MADFDDQLIGEGIHGQEVNDTAWKDAIWSDYESVADRVCRPNHRGCQISLISKCD